MTAMTEPLTDQAEARASLVNRLRGRYPVGPTLPSGEPEFGWLQFDTSALPAIHAEAADEIERLRAELEEAYHAVRVYAGHIDEFTKADLRRAGLVSKKVEQQP